MRPLNQSCEHGRQKPFCCGAQRRRDFDGLLFALPDQVKWPPALRVFHGLLPREAHTQLTVVGDSCPHVRPVCSRPESSSPCAVMISSSNNPLKCNRLEYNRTSNSRFPALLIVAANGAADRSLLFSSSCSSFPTSMLPVRGRMRGRHCSKKKEARAIGKLFQIRYGEYHWLVLCNQVF